MGSKLAELKDKASQLSDEEKAELALALIESLDGPPDAHLDEAWCREIEHRIAQIDKGEVQPVPSHAVFARLRKRLG